MAGHLLDDDLLQALRRMLADYARRFPNIRPQHRRRGAISGGGSRATGAVRRAKLGASAGDSNTILASLLDATTGDLVTSGEGFEITLKADIIGTNQRLDFAVPRLVIDDIVPVYQNVPNISAWAPGVNYVIGDIVKRDQVNYSATQDHLSESGSPPPSTSWETITFDDQWYVATLFMSSRTYTVEEP